MKILRLMNAIPILVSVLVLLGDRLGWKTGFVSLLLISIIDYAVELQAALKLENDKKANVELKRIRQDEDKS